MSIPAPAVVATLALFGAGKRSLRVSPFRVVGDTAMRSVNPSVNARAFRYPLILARDFRNGVRWHATCLTAGGEWPYIVNIREGDDAL